MKRKILNSVIAITMGFYGASVYADQQVNATLGTLDVTNGAVNFDVDFEYTATDTTLTGLGLTLYFDSTKLKWNEFSYILPNDKTGQSSSPVADATNGDGDATTDSKLTVAWVSLSGSWPGQSPIKVLTSNFGFAIGYQPLIGDSMAIRLTAESAAGHSFSSTPLEVTIEDQDNDTVPDLFDNCPTHANPQQEDQNSDGEGNACDVDDDGDGVDDIDDAFPLDPTETLDTDNDDIGNNTDEDDDADGLPDSWELQYGFNPLQADDAQVDSDQDGFSNYLEFIGGTNPTDSGSIPDAQLVEIQQSTKKASLTKIFPLSAFYNNTSNNETLSGMGVRIHFDSTKLNWNDFDNLFTQDFIGRDSAPISDTEDLDNIPETDLYVTTAWTSIGGQWPNRTLPLKLYDAFFAFRDDANLQVGDTTTIGFSSNATANGYLFVGKPYTVTVAPAFTWDIDGDGEAKPLTDGLLALRYLFGFTGNALIDNAVSASGTRITSEEIETEMQAGIESGILDIDGDSEAKPLTDGLLLLRYLFGFTGNALIDNAISASATRTTAPEIEAYLNENLP